MNIDLERALNNEAYALKERIRHLDTQLAVMQALKHECIEQLDRYDTFLLWLKKEEQPK